MRFDIRLEHHSLGLCCNGSMPVSKTVQSGFESWWDCQFIGGWCNGSTSDSDSEGEGSNPSPPAIAPSHATKFTGCECFLQKSSHLVNDQLSRMQSREICSDGTKQWILR